MSLLRWNPRRDAREPEVIAAFKTVSAVVRQLSGKGVPDLLVGYQRQWFLVEVKAPGRGTTAAQTVFFAEADRQRLPVFILRSAAEVLTWVQKQGKPPTATGSGVRPSVSIFRPTQ